MKLRLFALVCAAGAMLSAHAQPDPVSTSRLEKATAIVESIDHDSRMMELRTDRGVRAVQVPPDVRNLEQVQVGDRVVVEFYQGVAAKFSQPGESTPQGAVDVATGTARQAEGMRPGAAVANQVTTTVVIESIDQPSNTVSFTGPSGMTRTVSVEDPQARAFIRQLQEGDEVELTYTEALAVSVEPQEEARDEP